MSAGLLYKVAVAGMEMEMVVKTEREGCQMFGESSNYLYSQVMTGFLPPATDKWMRTCTVPLQLRRMQ